VLRRSRVRLKFFPSFKAPSDHAWGFFIAAGEGEFWQQWHKAQYRGSGLTITRPKTEEAKPKQIDISVN
jgi:hypothetical protein